MKHILKKIGFFALLVSFITGCEKWIDPEINVNPNNPGDVTMNVLLSSTQAAIAYTYGGELSRYPAIWMQHVSGVTRQSFATERYSVLDSDINNLWNTLYGGALVNLKILEEKAREQDAKHYLGMSLVLQAFAMKNITSVWGDVPFSEAFKGGEGITAPSYDDQQQIYSAIDAMLTEAIGLFGQDNPVGIPKPAADDIIYSGDVDKWTKLAQTLKVRAALHLAKRNGYGPVRDLINAGGLLESNDDDFEFDFGPASNEWNPRYQFDNDRADVRVGKRIVDLMVAVDDPRLGNYFYPNEDGEYVGSGPGEANGDASFIGPAYALPSATVFFLNYFELKFIEAEVFFGTDNAAAAEAYNEGVKASLAKHGVSNETWENEYANEDENTITFEKIMTGKYVAMFHSLETWTDWRRTGIPVLEIPAGNALDETPRRFLYPLDEKLYNTANVPEHTALSRVWWDVE
ncbi:MAG: SusD/RagB family nutrient-binding outer membrane lipoprotein [Bacteroidota bacterium]